MIGPMTEAESRGRRRVSLALGALAVALAAALVGALAYGSRGRRDRAPSPRDRQAEEPTTQPGGSGGDRAATDPVQAPSAPEPDDAPSPTRPGATARALGPRDAGARADSGAALTPMERYARDRAAFVAAVNELLAQPPPRRFAGGEPPLAWQRGFGHALRIGSAAMRACFSQSPASEGDAGGLLEYELALDAQGHVMDAAITVDPIGDPRFAECLLDALRALSLGPSPEGTLSVRGSLLVGARRWAGLRSPRASSPTGDGLTFVHAIRGLGPIPE